MHHLSIDLETFSSVPIARVGAQKYIESPDFEILLFAYSLDGGPVELIDLARGEAFPPWLLRRDGGGSGCAVHWRWWVCRGCRNSG